MQHPTVTVVIPTFNRLALLREAIESVKAQTYEDWELLVVDDGSTDHTAEYVQAQQDQRIDLIRSVHSGIVGAVRNLGVSHAHGRLSRARAFIPCERRMGCSRKLAIMVSK